MAKHDILVWNATSSIFETNLSSNTARIKGDSSALLSIESGSTELFKIDTTNSSVIFETHVTASGDISGSVTSTASFGGNVIVGRLSGTASLMTGADGFEEGHLSSSAQLASAISGAFNRGFTFDGEISGSSTSTGSFGYIYASDFDITHSNELIGLINVSESAGTLSGSAQIASDISGAFAGGFAYTGSISGSSTTTGSFNYMKSDKYVRLGTYSDFAAGVTNIIPDGTVSASAQIASGISGSFTKGFALHNSGSGEISGSSTSTASIDNFYAEDYSGLSSLTGFTNYIPAGTVSASAQIAGDISGSFLKGFAYSGEISGSISSTGSFDVVHASDYSGDASGLINTPQDGHISSSAQLATDISGSFISGFKVSGSARIHNAGGPIHENSLYFDGTGDYLTIPDSADWNFGSGSFTIDFWLLRGSAGARTWVMAQCDSGANNYAVWIEFNADNTIEFQDGNFESPHGPFASTGTITNDNSWHHVALVRNGATATWYIDGIASGTDDWGTTEANDSAYLLSIGRLGEHTSGTYFNGYIDELRISKGIARWTTDFTPPRQISSDSYTKLLIHNATSSAAITTFIDAGNTGHPVTGSGDVQFKRWPGLNTATASLDYIYSDHWVGDVTDVTNVYDGTNALSSSATIADDISGSFTSGFRIGSGSVYQSGTTYSFSGATVTASISKFNTETFETEEITITGSAVKIPVFSSTFNVDTRHNPSENDLIPTGSGAHKPISEYLDADTVGQLFVTDDGRLNFTYPTASVGYNPDSQDSGSYGSWTTGPSVIYRSALLAGAGSPNAFLGAGGRAPTVPAGNDTTQLFNGGTWSIGNPMIEGSRAGGKGAGTQNAAIVGGDQNPDRASVEEYNGVTWAAGGSLITGGDEMSTGGTINSAVFSGGTNRCACTEQYDGAAWSAGGAQPAPFNSAGGGGTENAHISNGGMEGSPAVRADTTRLYNGINWSLGPDFTLARNNLSSAGSQNAAVAFGGRANAPINHTGHTEEYNGSTWSTSGAMGTARYQIGDNATGGSPDGALAAGGDVGASPYTSFHTEEYFGGTFHGTLSAWSSGNNMITARRYTVGAAGGLQNAALAVGGAEPAISDHVEEYDGTTWTDGTFLINTTRGAGVAGTQQSAVKFGGQPNTSTEEYNGYVWQAGSALSTGTRYLGSAGFTEDSALAFGGLSPSYETCTEEYNGSTWSSGGALGTAVGYNTGVGTQNAALSIGGKNPASAAAGAVSGSTCHYNGTAWSVGGGLITDAADRTAAGTQNAALVYGGNASPNAQTAEYDGLVWTTVTVMNDGRFGSARAGGTDFGLAGGGGSPGASNKTEEYVRTHSGAPYLLTKKIKAQE